MNEKIEWNAGMLRQLFREMPEDRTFTAGELGELFNRLQPLFTKEQEKEITEYLRKNLSKAI